MRVPGTRRALERGWCRAEGVPVFCSLILVVRDGVSEGACCARRVSDVVDRFGPQIKERNPRSL